MAEAFPSDPEALLSRDDAAAALSASGFPVKPKTLATRATLGGGPPYQKFGNRAIYKWGDLLVWARSRLKPPSTRCTAMTHDDGHAISQT
jgi:hypothetical protein